MRAATFDGFHVRPLARAAAASRQTLDRLPIAPGRSECEAWIQLGPERRMTFRQTEVVEERLDGTVLLVGGTGISEIEGSEVPVHRAVGG